MIFSEALIVTQKTFSVLGSFLCFAVFLVVCDLYRKRHIFKFAKNYKGFPFYPVIGNGFHTIGRDIFTVIESVKKRFGLPCNLWNGHDYHYITVDTSEVKIILNHPNTFDKGAIYDSIKTAFGNTLLLSKFDSWKKNRKTFSKSFSQSILNNFVDVFYDKACILAEILKDSSSKDKYDIFYRLSLDNFAANIMRLDLNAQLEKDNKLLLMMERLHTVTSKRAFTAYFFPEWMYVLFTSEGRAAWKDLLDIRSIIYEIIQQKRQLFKKEKDFRENENKLPLMDLMLESEGKTFTDEEIFQEVTLFILAAADTSGNTLAHVFTLLGMNPHIQEKVYEEIKEVVGLTGPICYNDLPNLKYTEKVIFETMRLLPVTPIIERHAAADIQLENRKIPAGTNILISIFNLHRSERYWENPLQYNPDRFSPEEVAQRDPYAFIPFSSGPRNCIGMKYAMMMMKTTVAHVIRNFEIKSKYKSVDELEFTSYVTMKTIHELDCNFHPRKNMNNGTL